MRNGSPLIELDDAVADNAQVETDVGHKPPEG
jgi:hypothetical protein